MKIEFIKEVKLNGDVSYYTKVDGSYAETSLSLNEKEALVKYELIKKAKGAEPIIEVIKSEEI